MFTTFEIFFFGLVSFVWDDDIHVNLEVIDDAEHEPFVYLGAPHKKKYPLTGEFKIKNLPAGEVTARVSHTRNIPHLSEVAYRIDGQPVKLNQAPPLVVKVPLPTGDLTVPDYYFHLGQRTRPGAQPGPIPRITALKTTVEEDVEIVVNGATTFKVYDSSFIIIGNFGMNHEQSHFPKHRVLTNAHAIDDLIQRDDMTTSPNGESADNLEDARTALADMAAEFVRQMPATHLHGQDQAEVVMTIYTQVDCSGTQWP